ncbi:2-oxoacid:acceptor oxidoreductase family protein [Chloroflexota bacterium]
MPRTEIKIVGFGGQGILTMGRIIASAAYMGGKQVSVVTAYGGAVRGGSSFADVVIDDEEVDCARVNNPDFLVIFSQEGAEKFGKTVKEGGMVLYDPVTVASPTTKETANVFAIPATKIALDELGSGPAANSVMVGAFVHLSRLLDEKYLYPSLEDQLPEKVVQLNFTAFQKGLEFARKLAEE